MLVIKQKRSINYNTFFLYNITVQIIRTIYKAFDNLTKILILFLSS